MNSPSPPPQVFYVPVGITSFLGLRFLNGLARGIF